MSSQLKPYRALLVLFALIVSPIHLKANLVGDSWIFHYQNKTYNFKRSDEIRGTPMVALEDLVSKFSLKMSFDPESFRIEVSNPKNKKSIAFYPFSERILSGFFQSKLSHEPAFRGSRLFVPIDFGDRALRPLLSGIAPIQSDSDDTEKIVDIVIDAGHGGNDYGASITNAGKVLHEKTLSLEVATGLANELEALGVKTSLTRKNDNFLSLSERSQMANSKNAKLFLSIHLNADARERARGFEIYILATGEDDSTGRAAVAREHQFIPKNLPSGFDRALADLRARANFEKSLAWAKVAKKSLEKTFPPFGDSVKMGPFYVLYGAKMPALLLEMGFLTHPKDRSTLMDPVQRKELLTKLAKDLAQELKKGIRNP